MSLKDKGSLFWSFIYPILLLTLMAVAFSGLQAGQKPIAVAVESGHPFAGALQQIDILDVQNVGGDEALNLLRDKDVDGIFRADCTLLVRGEGMNETILREIGSELKKAGSVYAAGRSLDFTKQYVERGDQKEGMLEFVAWDVCVVWIFRRHQYRSPHTSKFVATRRSPLDHAYFASLLRKRGSCLGCRDELSANNMPSILSEMGMEGRLSRGSVEDITPRAGCRFFRHSGWAIHRRFEPVASQGESSTRHLTHAPVERRFRDDGSTVTSLYREKPPVAQSIQPRQHDQSHNLSSQCARVYEGVLGECCDFLCGGSFSVYRVSPVYTQTTIQEPVRTCDVMSRHREPEHIKG